MKDMAVKLEFEKPILVKSITLLKKILFDMDMVEKLKDVRPDKYHEGRRVYFFDYDPAIRMEVDNYINDLKQKRQLREQSYYEVD